MSSSRSLIINCGASHVCAAVFSAAGGKLTLEEMVTQQLRYDYSVEEQWLQSVANTLREISRRNSKIRGRATFILPGYQLFTRPIKVPHVEAGKQAQIIAFEAQNNMPFPLHEVVWGSQVIADDGVETDVILIAQKIEAANRFCGLMKSLGLEPVALQPASILDYNAYQFTHAGEEDTLVVNVGARSTNLTFINPNGFFVRNINFGGNAFTQKLADGLGKSFSQAEEIKVAFYSGQTSFDANDPAVAPLQGKAQDFMKQLSQEITRSIVTYRKASNRPAPARILLTGRGALLQGLSEFLCESQKVSVDYLNPVGVLQFGGGVTAEQADQLHYQLSEIVGAAARLIDPKAAGVNLLPGHIREKLAFERKKPFLVLAAACLALAPAPLIYQYMQAANLDKGQTSQLTSRATGLESLGKQIAEQSEAAQTIRTQIGQYEGLMNTRGNWILFFADLQNILTETKDVWLDSMKIVREQETPVSPGYDPATGQPLPAPPPAPPVYKIELNGRMLVRATGLAAPDPSSLLQEGGRRLNGLVIALRKNEFVASIPDESIRPGLDPSDRRLVSFTMVLIIKNEKPL